MICLIVIWISILFSYYIITHWVSYLQLDIFYLTSIGAGYDILGYIFAYVLHNNQVGVRKGFLWAFGWAFISCGLLILYAHAYHGTDLFSLSFCILSCKFGVSATYLLGYLAIIKIFRP